MAELEEWSKVRALRRDQIFNAGLFGRRRGYLPANPAADIKIRRRPEGEVSILTPDELRNLLSKCAPEIVPYVAICAFAGLRPAEAASLLW
jgi:integrase